MDLEPSFKIRSGLADQLGAGTEPPSWIEGKTKEEKIWCDLADPVKTRPQTH